MQIPGEKYYYNFEFNCIGTALAARRTGREDAEHFSADKMAKIKRYSSVGNKPFCEMEGLFSWNWKLLFTESSFDFYRLLWYIIS